LLRWYARHQRALPWRGHASPYAVWVSEIMLQQTQVATAVPYFRRFLARFPSVKALAAAPREDVLKAWEGLGYYRRAVNLQRAAVEIVARHGGAVPDTVEALRALPGIGDYTAGAIASICWARPVPAVDGNVVRVVSRFQGWGPLPAGQAKRRATEFLSPRIPSSRPGDFNQALMELGALLCRPQAPACRACPLRGDCDAARGRGPAARAWVVRPPRRVPHYAVVVGIVQRQGRVLVARRRADQMLGGLWEFPGGKQVRGWSLPATARRRILAETAVRVSVGAELATVRHTYSHLAVTLHAFACRPLAGRPRAQCVDNVRWVPWSRLKDYPFSTAGRKIIAAVLPKPPPDYRISVSTCSGSEELITRRLKTPSRSPLLPYMASMATPARASLAARVARAPGRFSRSMTTTRSSSQGMRCARNISVVASTSLTSKRTVSPRSAVAAELMASMFTPALASARATRANAPGALAKVNRTSFLIMLRTSLTVARPSPRHAPIRLGS